MKKLLLLAAAGLFISGASSATTLEGTFSGTYSCTGSGQQGITRELLTFIPNGNKFKLIVSDYYSIQSKFYFGNSIFTYTGTFNPKTNAFTFANLTEIGREPSGWSYNASGKGTVAADGLSLTLINGGTCSPTRAKKITASTVLPH